MFPDRAALYVVAIEDRQYKDFKIHCESQNTHTKPTNQQQHQTNLRCISATYWDECEVQMEERKRKKQTDKQTKNPSNQICIS